MKINLIPEFPSGPKGEPKQVGSAVYITSIVLGVYTSHFIKCYVVNFVTLFEH